MKQDFFKKIITSVMIFSAAILVLAPAARVLAVNADDYWGTPELKTYVRDQSGLGDAADRDPRQVAADIIKFVLGFLGIVAVVIILYAGFRWMTAGGNEDNVSEAKKILIAGLIGLVIILSAYALANFVIRQLIGATTGTIPS